MAILMLVLAAMAVAAEKADKKRVVEIDNGDRKFNDEAA